jgi:cardiolipin synthase (CMP-forming)
VQLSRRQIPNLITGLRIVLVVPIAWSLAHLRFDATIVLFGVAALSDAADGFLAKRFGWQSELGAFLDPIADKLLLATVFVTLSYLGLIPWWLTVAAVARDLIIVLGAITYRYCIGPIQAHPSVVSKLNTLAQVAFILAVMVTQRYELLPPWLLSGLGATMFLTVVVSGIDYVVTYGRRALQLAAEP